MIDMVWVLLLTITSSDVADICDKFGIKKGVFLAVAVHDESNAADDDEHKQNWEEEFDEIGLVLLSLLDSMGLL